MSKKRTARRVRTKGYFVIFCAHPDDEILGVGGTIAHYKKLGYETIAVIFSYGEGSHPWQKKKFTVETRVKESKKAGAIVGCKDTFFFGLKDATLQSEVQKPIVSRTIKEVIQKYQPVKIFTHSKDDPFMDHRAVFKKVIECMNETQYKCDVYSFDVWNPFTIRGRGKPKLIVDISEEFGTKMEALKCFKSQRFNAIIYLMPLVLIRAIFHGVMNKAKYAEVFLKEK